MIRILTQAVMECTEPGCGNVLPVKVYLLTSGGMGFKADTSLWQVAADRSQPGGPFLCKCPKHAVTVMPAEVSGRVFPDAH